MLKFSWQKRLIAPSRKSFQCFHSFSGLNEPQKVAFFGSDSFSITSLRALSKLSKDQPEAVKSIDVIAKHPKRTGRDLKQVTDVPIVEAAESEGLNVIRAETNTEILDLIKNQYSLAIAVSYGKLIPKKLIESVPYSLNLHPSLLPRYSGASPLQYALLNQDEFTGVTLQTLHPTKFDKGQIVDQSDPIRLEEHGSLGHLEQRLAIVGADMLVKNLVSGNFKNPDFISNYEYSYAKKIVPSMKEVFWDKYSADEIVARYNALGDLFTFKEVKVKQKRKPLRHEYRRVILSELEVSEDIDGAIPGDFSLEGEVIKIQTVNGAVSAKTLQLEFQKREDASTFWKGLAKRSGDTPRLFSTQPLKES